MVDLSTESVKVVSPPITYSEGRTDGLQGWKLTVSERSGEWVQDLANSLKGAKLEEKEGDPPTLTFNANAFNGDANEVRLVTREVQLYLDDDLMFVGPTLQRTADWNSVFDKYKAWGVEWYLGRKLFGALGSYLGQPRVFPESGAISMSAYGFGFTVRVAVMVTINPAFTGSTPGLKIQWSSGMFDRGETIVPITPDLPRGAEFEMTGSITIPSGMNFVTINASLDTTGASAGQITRGDFIGYFEQVIGLDTYANGVQYVPEKVWAQSVALTKGTDLNIGYAEDQPELGPLKFEVPDIIDVASLFDQGFANGTYQWKFVNTRTTRILTIFRPMVGRDIDPGELTLYTDGVNGNISQYYMQEDGTKARSKLTEVGEDGWRGTARFPSAWGGLLLEEEEGAPANTPKDQLETVAYNKLRVNLGLIRALKVRLPVSLLKTLRLGDRVFVQINHGSRQVEEVHRVVSREIEIGKPFWNAELTTNPPGG